MSIPPPRQPFEVVGADHLGPFKQTVRGNRHVFVLMDYLTKWVIAILVPDFSSASIIRAIRENVVPQHGVIGRLITDRGTAFTSEEFTTEL